MKRIFFVYSSLFLSVLIIPSIVHGDSPEQEGEKVKRRVGVSFLLEQVGKTVDETVKSVGDVVDSTVDTVVPVVENTTKAVQSTTNGVTGIVEELPEVPVVSPVIKEVSQVVERTTEAVTKTVSGTVEVVAKEVVRVPVLDVFEPVGNVTSAEKSVHDLPTEILDKMDEEERPIPLEPFVNDVPVSKKDQLLSGTSEDFEEEEPVMSGREAVHKKITLEPVNRSSAVEKRTKSIEKSERAEDGQPMDSSSKRMGVPVVMTTGTTSISSPSFAIGGHADIMQGVIDEIVVLETLPGRQWDHHDANMRIQWIHAPPGKPPQYAPFLQAY